LVVIRRIIDLQRNGAHARCSLDITRAMRRRRFKKFVGCKHVVGACSAHESDGDNAEQQEGDLSNVLSLLEQQAFRPGAVCLEQLDQHVIENLTRGMSMVRGQQ